jgi:DNA polymerase III delta prime subunit
MKNKILIEKYRPQNINELIITKDIKKIYNNIIENNTIPNLVLYGYSGQGKTTFINILIKELNYNSIYINGSEERGNNIIDIIDNYSKSFNINNNKKKVIIIDEADSIITKTQILIMKKIKKYKNVSFCIICNYINKIISYIKDLCIDINFKLDFKDNKKEILDYLNNIIIKENIIITKDELINIYNNSKCDIRKMINMLLIKENKNENKKYDNPELILELAEIQNDIFSNKCEKNIQYYRLLKYYN